MADRESLLRDAQRKMLNELRKAPRPDNDTPSLEAWFPPALEPLDVSAQQLVALARALEGQNPYVQSWRVVRGPEDHDAATGLLPTRDVQGYIAFMQAQVGNTDAAHSVSMLGFSDKIFPDDPRIYSASLSYAGGMEQLSSNSLTFSCTAKHVDNNLTFVQWVDMIRLIVAWRTPRYIAVGSHGYGLYDRVYDHREWNGWMGWFPQRIAPQQLPAFAITQQIGEGSLVATQDSSVLTRYEDQKNRAQQLEIALAEAGVLPTGAQVRGR